MSGKTTSGEDVQRTSERSSASWERVALYVAVLTAGSAFSILFTSRSSGDFAASSIAALGGGGAFVPLLGATIVAALVGSAGRWRFVLIFPAIVLYALIAVYGVPPLFSLSGWESLFYQIGGDLYSAAEVMYLQPEPIPYDVSSGLVLVLIPMVMIIGAFATSATLYERTPVISIATLGLTIGVLSTISFEDGAGPFFLIFVLAALGLLLFSGAAGDSGGLMRAGVIVAAAVAALVLVVPKAPLSDETVSPGAIDWTRIGAGSTSRLDVQADVGDYLSAGRDARLMRVSSTEPLFWRGGTLDYFDGVRWSNTTKSDEEAGEEIAAGVETRPVVQSVQVLDSRTDLIFGGYKISGVSSNLGPLNENPDGSWNAGRQLTDGDGYRVLSEIPQPTTSQLQGSGTEYPREVREKFLQTPRNIPNVVDETAQRISNNYDVSTPYNASRAVERYLAYDGNFTYNLDVDYRRADWAIDEFLGDGREGFCTQFATSMALILRDMDIPTRVVYGATTGQTIDENVYLVTGANMHTWVEVYFPGVGWYPFDPTPGFSMPETMQANAPRPTEPNSQDQPQSENQSLNQNEEQQQQETPNSPAPDAPESQDEPVAPREEIPAWPFITAAIALLVAAIPLTKRALLARGRPEDLYRDLTGRLGDSLSPRVVRAASSSSLTVTERLSLLAGACGLAAEPFSAFARAYSERLYAPQGPQGATPDRSLSRSYRRAAGEYRKLPLWRRVIAGVNPDSLIRRLALKATSVRARLFKEIRLQVDRRRRGKGRGGRGN